MKSPFPSLMKYFLFLAALLTSVLSIAQAPDANGIIYVKPIATGSGDGSSWADATDDLHNAIKVIGVRKVFVASGTYKVGDQSFVMKNGVEIYGGFDPGAGIDDLNDARLLPRSQSFRGGSILDGENIRPVVWNVSDPADPMNNTAVLDGFSLASGYHDNTGGGIHNESASPTLRNLLIRHNKTDRQGAGISNDNSSPIISNTIFLENYTYEGSAIVCDNPATSPMILTNVLFIRNEALPAEYSGSTIETSGDMILNNVTMADNYGSAILIKGGTTTIRNSIIMDGVAVSDGSYSAQYSLIKGDSNTTNGNIDGKPYSSVCLFNSPQTKDYTHRSCSPAINAGSNALNFAGTTDVAGNPRVINSAIDLGAFETEKPVCGPDANGVIYVKTTPSGSGTGESWANATDNFRTAAHLNGVHQVWVEKGTYNLLTQTITWPWSFDALFIGGSLALKNNVEIYGGFDAANGIDDLSDNRILPDKNQAQGSIINGGTRISCVWNIRTAATAIDNSAVLDGFTLTGGWSRTDGAGINNEFASPTLRNLIISDNICWYGAGVFNRNASPIMANVVIRNNKAWDDGGGVYNDALSAPLMTNVQITGNRANNGGGMFNRNSSPALTNVVITANIATQQGGAAYSNNSSAPTMLNVTIASNSPNAFNLDNASLSLANTIVYGGTAGDAYTAQNSLIENNSSTANGNIDATGITATSIFSDAAGGDYTLKSGSSAANSGSNSLYPGLGENTKDIAGNARVYDLAQGGVIDLGAYESTSELVIVPDANGIVYVKTTSSGGGTGSSWANATGGLQKAINTAGVQKVFVASGNYNVPSPNSFVMKNNVAIYGGFDPVHGIDDLADSRILPNHGAINGSVLSGKNERPVIWNSNAGLTETAILDGFTLTDGYSTGSSGAGIMNDHVSPTLRNLVISGNHSTLGGGGIFNNHSSPVISDVIIKENTAVFIGGGIGNIDASSPILTNVQITANTASTGAGVWFLTDTGNATFTNVTIAANTSGNAVTVISGGVNFNNSIIYGGITGSYNAQYSLVEGSVATNNGNLDAAVYGLDDIFENPANGDYTLVACSPATNAGSPDNSFMNLPQQDLTGNSRIVAGRIDMGAYENIVLAGNAGIAILAGKAVAMQTPNGTTTYYNSCNEMLASVATTGVPESIAGITTARVWIDDIQPAQYVRRHYEITPDNNAATAVGRITLYFTQADFNEFNSANPASPLPDGPSGSITNLLIEKHGGISTDGTGRPSSYTGPTETISNVTVVWNSVAERWEVGFNTTGFSGFFVKTSASPLPVKWISFTAHLNDDSHGVLEWKVDQANVAGYQIERSSNALNFRAIGTIAGNSDGIAQYRFIDPIAATGMIYYRIRQTDLDGTYGYSRIQSVSGPEKVQLACYPNPVRDKVTIEIGAAYVGTQLKLVNAAGIMLHQLTVREPIFNLNLDKYPTGTYLLYTFDGRFLKLIRN